MWHLLAILQRPLSCHLRCGMPRTATEQQWWDSRREVLLSKGRRSPIEFFRKGRSEGNLAMKRKSCFRPNHAGFLCYGISSLILAHWVVKAGFCFLVTHLLTWLFIFFFFSFTMIYHECNTALILLAGFSYSLFFFFLAFISQPTIKHGKKSCNIQFEKQPETHTTCFLLTTLCISHLKRRVGTAVGSYSHPYDSLQRLMSGTRWVARWGGGFLSQQCPGELLGTGGPCPVCRGPCFQSQLTVRLDGGRPAWEGQRRNRDYCKSTQFCS